MNVIEARGFDVQGEVVRLKDLLEGNRAWEALRLLLNFENAAGPLLTLLVLGLPALLPLFERMPHLEERMGVKCLLRPLTLDETVSYVTHRLKVAGANRDLIDSAAMEALYQLTQGVPRRINRLCDLALLIGYAGEQPSISAAQLRPTIRPCHRPAGPLGAPP